MATMPAALATALRQIRCDEIPIPEPTPGMVLVKTRMASICGSDLHIVYMGWNAHEFPLPHGHPGHEGLGEVVDGGVTEFAPGDLVLTVPNIWGSKSFAGYQLIQPHFLLKLPTDVPEGHLLMAQQLGTVVFACRRLPSLLGQTVAVIGQGSVGLFHDFMLRYMGAHRIIAIEPVPARLAAARAMGVDVAIDVTGRRATEAVLELTNGEGADLVIYDCTYTEDEWPKHVGWGHSTWNEGMRLCQAAGVKRLAIFHHDPDHDDAFMDALAAEAETAWSGNFIAREGMVVEVE